MSLEQNPLYEFGKFRCDPAEHLLFCDSKTVSLAPKAFEILLALIESNGRLLTKEELMQKVWPDTFVEEANLTINISAVRKALGDSNQALIETVPKRGYRFLAKVTEISGDKDSPPTGVPLKGEKKPITRWTPWARRIGIATLLLVVVAMVVVLSSTRTAKLSDKDTVVLADFDNSTGDSVFDGALRQGLSAQLEQSPFLNLLSDQRIAQTLSLMSRPAGTRLTSELAHEVCQRTVSTAVLEGTISQVGSRYLLTLKAANCANEESLGSAEAEAADKDHVLDALSKVASDIRRKLGESLTSVQKYDVPAQSVTTPSLEALKAYSLGYESMLLRTDYTSAIPLFQQAIDLDPNFAMAYARMGTSYYDLNETVRGASNITKAYQLQHRVSERERLYIVSHYAMLASGNLEEGRKICELWAQTYPHDAPYNNLGIVYSELGEYDKAITAYQQAVKLGPQVGAWYAALVSGYVQSNRLEEAKATARDAYAHKTDSPDIHLYLYWVDFLQHDTAGMEREASILKAKPGFEDEILNYEANTALYSGQLNKARTLSREAVASARKYDEKEAAALYEAAAALREALVGNTALAKRQVEAARTHSQSRDVVAVSAIALELAGDSAQSKRLGEDLARRFPEDTVVQLAYLPTLHASDLVRQPDSAEAVRVAQFGGNLETVRVVLYPAYMVGQAYLAAKQGRAAADEFRKVINHPGVVCSDPIGALAHLQLGRALVMAGEKNEAKAAYQEFLTIWKDADPDLPIFKQAKVEFARLN